jgi:aminopeptidase-like protein
MTVPAVSVCCSSWLDSSACNLRKLESTLRFLMRRIGVKTGTQYWTRQPHVPGYIARYGILLDMVGARNAQFRMEGNSQQVASDVNQKIWSAASALGYSNYFLNDMGGYVTDDHVYVIRYGIPSVDLIGGDRTTSSGFAPHWHTHADNLDIIDPQTLKAVGQTLMEVVYREPS